MIVVITMLCFFALAAFAHSEYLSSKGHNSRAINAFYLGLGFIILIMIAGIVAAVIH